MRRIAVWMSCLSTWPLPSALLRKHLAPAPMLLLSVLIAHSWASARPLNRSRSLLLSQGSCTWPWAMVLLKAYPSLPRRDLPAPSLCSP